jgi:uncharacterized protein (TIGR02996 family)
MPVARELEQAILRDPYDREAYRVYADWLEASGDRRGELMNLHLAAESTGDPAVEDAARDLIESEAGYFLGPLADHARTYDGSDRDALTWRFGFIHGAVLSHDSTFQDLEGSLADVLRMLLDHPSARFLAELSIERAGSPDVDDLQPLIDIVAVRAPATLRRLDLGIPDPRRRVGRLGSLWPALSRLTHLTVKGGSFSLGDIRLPSLVRAEIRTDRLSHADARAIGRATWPSIGHLDVWFGAPARGGDADIHDATPLFERDDLGELRHLGVMNCAFADDACRLLPDAPFAGALDELDLSMGCMTDDGARHLADHDERFDLESLDVSMNYLSPHGLALLRHVAQFVHGEQQKDEAETDGERIVSYGG